MQTRSGSSYEIDSMQTRSGSQPFSSKFPMKPNIGWADLKIQNLNLNWHRF
jgi:hypothetical protein